MFSGRLITFLLLFCLPNTAQSSIAKAIFDSLKSKPTKTVKKNRGFYQTIELTEEQKHSLKLMSPQIQQMSIMFDLPEERLIKMKFEPFSSTSSDLVNRIKSYDREVRYFFNKAMKIGVPTESLERIAFRVHIYKRLSEAYMLFGADSARYQDVNSIILDRKVKSVKSAYSKYKNFLKNYSEKTVMERIFGQPYIDYKDKLKSSLVFMTPLNESWNVAIKNVQSDLSVDCNKVKFEAEKKRLQSSVKKLFTVPTTYYLDEEYEQMIVLNEKMINKQIRNMTTTFKDSFWSVLLGKDLIDSLELAKQPLTPIKINQTESFGRIKLSMEIPLVCGYKLNLAKDFSPEEKVELIKIVPDEKGVPILTPALNRFLEN